MQGANDLFNLNVCIFFFFLEWVNDSLHDRMRSNVVGLMVRNETLLPENKQMMKLFKNWETDKHNLARMNQKNISLKMEVKECHKKERSIIWAMLLFDLIIAIGYVISGRRRM